MAAFMGDGGTRPTPVGKVLAGLLENAFAVEGGTEPETVPAGQAAQPGEGRYDFDLAEFPLFRFSKPKAPSRGREPLVYSDTIRGRDGAPVTRLWKAYPGPFGFGGASTQALLYDLLQLYWEQGARGSQIQFGTLRQLCLRRGRRNPSKRDYDQMRRDIDILRGYDFHCQNAFWDVKRQAYVDMRWRLFGSVFYFKPGPADDDGAGLPFGFIEVSPVLREVARTRGFFSLGFAGPLFHELRPLEQRLAVYLAKKFVSQAQHRRFVDHLARALPIEASAEYDTRKILRSAAEGLLRKKLPILSAFRLERSKGGRWLAVFDRGTPPRQDTATVRRAAEELAPVLQVQVERIIEAVGTDTDRFWWTHCVKRLGHGPIDRALGLLKEARQSGKVRSPGAFLTKIIKDIAEEQRVALH